MLNVEFAEGPVLLRATWPLFVIRMIARLDAPATTPPTSPIVPVANPYPDYRCVPSATRPLRKGQSSDRHVAVERTMILRGQGYLQKVAQTTTGILASRGRVISRDFRPADAVSRWRDRLKIRSDLRLCDARGTTRLLWANASLKDIATFMGWSIKHAAEVIERYVALSPQMADGIGQKLAQMKAKSGTKL